MSPAPKKLTLDECEERGRRVAERVLAQDAALKETDLTKSGMAFDIWAPLGHPETPAKPEGSEGE